jgi:hypothetical protein
MRHCVRFPLMNLSLAGTQNDSQMFGGVDSALRTLATASNDDELSSVFYLSMVGNKTQFDC